MVRRQLVPCTPRPLHTASVGCITRALTQTVSRAGSTGSWYRCSDTAILTEVRGQTTESIDLMRSLSPPRYAISTATRGKVGNIDHCPDRRISRASASAQDPAQHLGGVSTVVQITVLFHTSIKIEYAIPGEDIGAEFETAAEPLLATPVVGCTQVYNYSRLYN